MWPKQWVQTEAAQGYHGAPHFSREVEVGREGQVVGN